MVHLLSENEDKVIAEKLQETLPLANGTEGFVYSRTDGFQRLIHCNVCMRANIPANALYIHDEQDLHVNLLSHYRNETQNVLMKSASIHQMFSPFCDTANQSRFQHIANEHQLCFVGSDTLLEIENGGFMCAVCRKENIGDIEVAAHLESTEHVIFYVGLMFPRIFERFLLASDDQSRAFLDRFPINFEALNGRLIPKVMSNENLQQNRDFYLENLWNSLPTNQSSDFDALLDGIQLPNLHDDLLERIVQDLNCYPNSIVKKVHDKMARNTRQ